MPVEFQNKEYEHLESTEQNTLQQQVRNGLAKQIDAFEFQNTNQKADIKSAFSSMFDAIDGLDVDFRLVPENMPARKWISAGRRKKPNCMFFLPTGRKPGVFRKKTLTFSKNGLTLLGERLQ